MLALASACPIRARIKQTRNRDLAKSMRHVSRVKKCDATRVDYFCTQPVQAFAAASPLLLAAHAFEHMCRIVPNPTHAEGDYRVHLFAFNTRQWNSSGILRLDVFFTIANSHQGRPASADAGELLATLAPPVAANALQVAFARRSAERQATAQQAQRLADLTFRAYQQWERQQISHGDAVEGMRRHLGEVIVLHLPLLLY